MITEYDRGLASDWVLELGAGGDRVELQFPPWMPSDSRSANWVEGALRDKEPIAVFETTEARVMNLELQYIVGENGWDADRVAQQIQLIKGYFLQINREGTPGLVTKFKFVLHGPVIMSGRLINASFDYSRAYVGRGNSAYPLRTTAKIECKIWTKGQPVKVDIPDLLSESPISWA